MEVIINLLPGSVFKHNASVFVKLMNPEIPPLAKVSDYPVWAADIGNGHVKTFDPLERVDVIGRLMEMCREEIFRFERGNYEKSKSI